MEQRLIVEGKDAIVLSNICQLRGLPPPAGYANPTKFKNKFVVDGKGYDGALEALQQTLDIPGFQNIGIILDANNAGMEARWRKLKSILANVFPEDILQPAIFSPSGLVLQAENLPTVGIWLMPDNLNNGYLEHFLSGLIPAGDKVWEFATLTIDDLTGRDFCKFSGIRKQKALIHTWLAWQESPGLPFGTAAQAGYFDVSAPAVQPFLDWFSQTFVLE